MTQQQILFKKKQSQFPNQIKFEIITILSFELYMGNQQSFQLQQQQYPWSKDYSLVDKQPLNNTFVLHHMPSNNVYKIKLFITPKNNTSLKELITTKIFKPSPYVLKLQNTQTCTKQNYCSQIQQIYLMYPYIQTNLKEQILNRKFRKEGFIQSQIMLVIQNISKALMHLTNIGQPHKNLSAIQILISQQRGILLNDPWLSDNVSKNQLDFRLQGYNDQKFHQNQNINISNKLEEHYPSPQKILYKNNLIESYNQYFSSLFSLGLIVLQMIYMESMDILYEKGYKKIYYNKVKQKIEGVSHESIKQDLRRLLSYQPRIRQSVCIRYKRHKTDYLFLKKPRQDFKDNFSKFNNFIAQNNNEAKEKFTNNIQILNESKNINNNFYGQQRNFSNNRQNYLLPQHFENKIISERFSPNQFNSKKNQSIINQLKNLNKRSPQLTQLRKTNVFSQNSQKMKLGHVIANRNIKRAQSGQYKQLQTGYTKTTQPFLNTLNYQNNYNLNYQIKNPSNSHLHKNPSNYQINYINFKQPYNLKGFQSNNYNQLKTPLTEQPNQLNQNQNQFINQHIKQAKSLYQDSNHQSFVISSYLQKNIYDQNILQNQQKGKQMRESQRNSFAVQPGNNNQVIFDQKNSFQMGSKISHRQKSNSLSFDQLDPILFSKIKDQNKYQKSEKTNQQNGYENTQLNSSMRSSEERVKTSLQTPERYPLKGRQNSTIRQVSEQDYSHSQRSGSYSHYYQREKSVPLNQTEKQIISMSPNRNNNLIKHQNQKDNKQNYPKIKQIQNQKYQMIYEDGSSYIGQLKNNKKNGFGVLYYPNKKAAYQGNWINDDFNGRGRIYNAYPENVSKNHSFQNLSEIDNISIWQSYDGQFFKDQKHGKGRIKLSNGQIFNGNWANDLPNGEGKYYCNDGTVINGNWKKGIYQS